MSKSDTKIEWAEAMNCAEQFVVTYLPLLERVAVMGSTFRRKAQVHDVDLLVTPLPGVMLPKFEKPLNVFVTTSESWETAVMQYAPDVESVIGTRYRAKIRGFKLNQYGLFVGSEKNWTLVSRSAQEIYQLVGMSMSQWVKKSLAGELVWQQDELLRKIA